jgi:hypothetical protein
VPANTPATEPQHLLRQAPADFPDPLLEATSTDLKRGGCQAVWITIAIPAEAAPGEYQSRVHVRSGGESTTLPLHLTVMPLIMPDERHLDVTNWYRTSHFDRFHNCPEEFSERFFEVLRYYAEAMAAHRQNVFLVQLNVFEVTGTVDGKFTVNFKNFDRYADTFWKTGGFDRMELDLLRDSARRDAQARRLRCAPGGCGMPPLGFCGTSTEHW